MRGHRLRTPTTPRHSGEPSQLAASRWMLRNTKSTAPRWWQSGPSLPSLGVKTSAVTENPDDRPAVIHRCRTVR